MSEGRGTSGVVWVAVQHLRDWSSGGVLPAFVVGKELRDGALGPLPPQARRPLRRYMNVALAHQYGGDRCLNTGLCGLVLPLHENVERSIASEGASQRPVDLLLDALRRRAQSVAVHDRTHPMLPLPVRPMHTGREMTWSELRVVADAMATSYTLPAPVRGWEALIDLGPIHLEWVEGWTAVAFAIDDEDGFAHPVDRKRLRAADARALGEPQLWLLWENCD